MTSGHHGKEVIGLGIYCAKPDVHKSAERRGVRIVQVALFTRKLAHWSMPVRSSGHIYVAI